MTAFPCRLDGEPATVEVGEQGLVVGGRVLAWVDADEVTVDGHDVQLQLVDAKPVALSQLGKGLDKFLDELRAARSSARRAALLQWAGTAPIDSYVARHDADLVVDVVLFAGGLTLEPRVGRPTFVPLALIDDVARAGYMITLTARGLEPVTVQRLGERTDEFLLDLDRARRDLTAATAAAYAQLDPGLAGFSAPDGWAVDAATAGTYWVALRAAVSGQQRGSEVDALAGLAGDRLRLGVATTAPDGVFPFALAPVGTRVAVEGTDANARATFIFECDDVDRLNAVLLLTNFRREAISLPDNELGRWALAVRTLDVVRWARERLVARVVHDEQWAAKVTAALGAGGQ